MKKFSELFKSHKFCIILSASILLICAVSLLLSNFYKICHLTQLPPYDYTGSTFQQDFNSISPEIPLFDNHPVYQEVVPNYYSLNSLALFFQADLSNDFSKSTIKINIADMSGKLIYAESFPCNRLIENTYQGWFTVFPDNMCLENLQDDLLTIQVSSENIKENSVFIGTTPANKYDLTMFTRLFTDTKSYTERQLAAQYIVSCESSASFDDFHAKNRYQSIVSIIKYLFIDFIVLILGFLMIDIYSIKKRISILHYCYMIVTAVIVFYIISRSNASLFNPWYNLGIVRHGGGETTERTVTNSKEAIYNSLDLGCRLIEIDFAKTTDNKLVLTHIESGDNLNMTKEEFMSSATNSGITPLTYSDLLDIMEQYPDLCIITDTKKCKYDESIEMINMIYNETIETGHKNLLNNLKIQIYNDAMYYGVKDIYNFDIIYTLYNRGLSQMEQCVDFCRRNDIDAITIFKSGWDEREDIQNLLKQSGLPIYVHTVNTRSEYYQLLDEGVHSVYSDSLY